MTEISFHPVAVSPQKRPLTSYIDTAAYESILPTLHYDMAPSSPTPSTLSSLSEMSTVNSTIHNNSNAHSSSEPPTKKRKLNFLEKEAEKAAKQREKDEKQRLKAEEKARKEEEKARKDEEKRKIAEEKENAKRLKDLEKAQKQKEKEKKEAEKDAEKAAKDAERLKKERAQPKLNAFFGKPTTAAAASPAPSASDDISEGILSRRSSVASVGTISLSVNLNQTTSTNPDHDKWILPFFIPENTIVAPQNRFKHGEVVSSHVPVLEEKPIQPLSRHFQHHRKRVRRRLPPVKEVMNHAQELANIETIDLVIQDTLETYPFKILQFHEDVRPPYQGTITRHISPNTSRRLVLNPNSRQIADVNYDYDSEAEWEPPGEDDEELNDEDEMSEADEAGEDMADFLDDADDIGRRKGPLIDMEPVSSGLCWGDAVYDDHGMSLAQYRMDVLHDSTRFPIDPFSTRHWTDSEKASPVKPETSTTPMLPPRPPLSTLTGNVIPFMKKEVGIDGKPMPQPQKPIPSNSNKAVKLVDPEFMPAFKAAIQGSDLTKAGLIEILKKQFPKCSKDAIKDTLGTIAARVGKKEAEKKWVLINQD